MKKTFLALTLLGGLVATAQKKPVPAKKPVAAAPLLKTTIDSVSYSIGVNVASFYQQQGITKLNAAVLSKAINDVLSGKKTLLNDEEANGVMMRCMQQASEAKAKPAVAAGEMFLAQNKTKPGVKTTPSGLQYQVIKEGSGARPTVADSVTCHYAGTLIDGTEFDNSYRRGEPITFAVGGVIAGWTEALQLMSVGSKYKLFVPYQLAYGTNDVGAIPAGSVLVFEVELLSIPTQK